MDYLAKVARAGGARVLDYDDAFVAADFIDNDHLTAAGNAKFARLLSLVIPNGAPLHRTGAQSRDSGK